jgi:hypothetical protein
MVLFGCDIVDRRGDARRHVPQSRINLDVYCAVSRDLQVVAEGRFRSLMEFMEMDNLVNEEGSSMKILVPFDT